MSRKRAKETAEQQLNRLLQEEADRRVKHEAFNRRHNEILSEIETELFGDIEYHKGIRANTDGIRSSQISALVAYLMRRGVL
jgi:hypothetical protein